MMNPSHIERIKELFLILKTAYEWSNKNECNKARQMELFDRSKPLFDELETLGVSRQFSATVFFFGPEINEKLVNQFKDGGER